MNEGEYPMANEPNVKSDEIASAIYAYLEERFPSLAPCAPDTPLLEGAIDSLGFLELMMFLSERFGISMDDDNFDFHELATPESLVLFVKRMTS
jgi:acyl carrier protein